MLEGIDGAGKTTVARMLCEKLKEQRLDANVWKYSQFRSDDPFVQAQMDNLHTIIWTPGQDEPDTDLLGTYFYLYLLAAWSSVKQKHCIAQLKGTNRIEVFDGWHYRTIVKAFIRQQLSQSWLQSLFDTVANPDVVVLLDVDPAVSWRRRPRFKASEIGRWDGFTGDTYSAYCAYQGRIRRELLVLAVNRKWMVVRQTADMNETDVVENVYSHVKCALACSS